jgi:Amino acid synthesis
MGLVEVRKYVLQSEEIWHEGGAVASNPLFVVTSAAVVRNPYADHFEEQLAPYMSQLRSLGAELSRRAISAMGGADRVQAYGKGAIVGEDGELEHGALWHEAGGWALREALGGRKAIVR